MQSTRKGGVFRTLKPKGSLAMRNYYMRKHCPADVAGDFRDVATPGFVEQARDSSVLFVDPHNEAIDTDSKFW